MNEVYRCNIRSYHNQMGLADAEDSVAYPGDWKDEGEILISGPKGVAVKVAEDAMVELVVYSGDGEATGELSLSTEIVIGVEGLSVGTPPDFDFLPWSSGKTSLRVYLEGPRRRPYRVMFVLGQPEAYSDVYHS